MWRMTILLSTFTTASAARTNHPWAGSRMPTRSLTASAYKAPLRGKGAQSGLHTRLNGGRVMGSAVGQIDAGVSFSHGESPSGRRLQNRNTSGLLLEAEVYNVAGRLASEPTVVIYVCFLKQLLTG